MATAAPALAPGASPPVEPAAPTDFETTVEVGYYQLVWRRFRSRKIALVSAIALLVLTVACFFLPDQDIALNSVFALGGMGLLLAGSDRVVGARAAIVATVGGALLLTAAEFVAPGSFNRLGGVLGVVGVALLLIGVARHRAMRTPAVAAGTLLLIVAAIALVGYLVGPHLIPSGDNDPTNSLLGPLTHSTGPGPHTFHLLGTDEVGRDLLRRNLEGGQVSLTVGALAMILTILVATILGALSGFIGGAVDALVTAVTNAMLSIPALLVLAVLAKVLGQNKFAIIAGIALVAWPQTSRIVRSVVLSIREKEFVEAARALGTPRMRIISRHVLPNVLGPIVVSASLTIGAAIILESALSFLGIGIGEPTATWGSLLNHGYNHIQDPNYSYGLWPGLCILTTVLCFNYIGDALRDAFDPRSLER